MLRTTLALSLGLALALPMAAHAGNAAAGAQVFKQACGICHSIAPGRNGIGPSLFGVVGRKIAEAPGYHYSAADKDSGIVWDAASLDKYLTNPRAMVPGTKMTYAGLKDATKRADLIAYLETLK